MESYTLSTGPGEGLCGRHSSSTLCLLCEDGKDPVVGVSARPGPGTG